MEYMIRLLNVVKSFGGQTAVDNISADVKRGEFLTLLGPSGCGKTTTLRMIAGFEEPTSGQIILDGDDVSNKNPYERDVNTVFQNYALFPHMNIFNNIAFGLKIRKAPKEKVKEKVMEALDLVQLNGFEKRYPKQLSGGQKQRIAIARAIVNSPKVLLLDEPLGALDLKLRKQMQFELKHLQRKLGITFIYVTHDQEEALTMSDRIAVMSKGKIEQIGTPDEIYERPKTKFVADFIGETNIFEGKIKENNGVEAEALVGGSEIIKVIDEKTILSQFKKDNTVYVAVRPERMKLSYDKNQSDNIVKGKIKERVFVGSINRTIVVLNSGKEIIVNEPAADTLKLENGKENVFVYWKSKDGVVIS
ncbi:MULTISPECIES: ABC transporter ATP-binding protein [Clostridium]|uniref:ABC transporter ATP-binding protein n=1 Tax=Clostridium TaxID=1485 RepID=UPI000824E368|nr:MULTISPECIES: ABC transporter ATP-binding protein [Clostridium]PJI06900.1 ABC transporter ATP-binding protein [Clostridium sp. CT7]